MYKRQAVGPVADEEHAEQLARHRKIDGRALAEMCIRDREAAGVETEFVHIGTKAIRGCKVLTIPAHTGSGCRDVHVMCVPFVLPEDPDACGCNNGMCTGRTFRVRIIAHPMDLSLIHI